jgi:hypothetical protein
MTITATNQTLVKNESFGQIFMGVEKRKEKMSKTLKA